MKKIMLIVMLTLVMAGAALAGATPTPRKIMDSQTISASGAYTSTVITLKNLDGVFALQATVSGDGTVKFEFLGSINSTDFVEAENADDILSGITKTSGPDSNGKVFIQFTPDFSYQGKIRVTETGGANSATVSAWLLKK